MVDPVSIITTILGGGVTGVLGAAIQRFADYKTKRLELEIAAQQGQNEIALRRVDAEIMAQEWAARTKVADTEAAAKVEVADAAAFSAALQMEPKLYSEKVTPTAGQAWLLIGLDVLRGLVRPALTVYLCAITTLIYFQARSLVAREDITPDQALELTHRVVETVLYLTTTCTLFWFGTRNKSKGAS